MSDEAAPAVVVMLHGEYDIARTADLRDEILGAHRDEPRVLVDMAAVTFFDSSALRALLDVHGVLAGFGVVMTVCNPSSIVGRVLSMLGMAEIFGVDPTA